MFRRLPVTPCPTCTTVHIDNVLSIPVSGPLLGTRGAEMDQLKLLPEEVQSRDNRSNLYLIQANDAHTAGSNMTEVCKGQP